MTFRKRLTEPDDASSTPDRDSECDICEDKPDALHFLSSWISDPLRMGAILPSGESLARLITVEISGKTGPVLELGAGTGVFTRALLDRGVDESDLTLVEYGSDFTQLLEFRFPKARVINMDATQLTGHNLFEPGGVNAVVSGLPLLSMPSRKVIAILWGVFSYLGVNGAFYQFTYGLQCPVQRRILDRLGLEAMRIGRTIRNVPPAAVYRITRITRHPSFERESSP